MDAHTIDASSIVPTPMDTHSVDVALDRVNNFLGHAFAMVGHLEKQNVPEQVEVGEKTAYSIAKIYAEARVNIETIGARIKEQEYMKGGSALTKKEIKNLAKLMKKAEKEITKEIWKAQIKVAAQIGSEGTDGVSNEKVRSRIKILAKGGWKAKMIRLFVLTSKTNQQAINGFKNAQLILDAASKRDIGSAKAEESQIQQDRRVEFEDFQKGEGLKRRAGIIGLNGIYRVQVTFSDKQIHKQLKSYIAQELSQTERTTLTKDISIEGENKTVKSTLIPLNKEFDQILNLGIRIFEKIFGAKGGVSSVNRQEPHLVNGWDSRLENEKGETIYESLRHGITSDKFEGNAEIRKKNSRQAAGELLKAAVLKEIASRGLTLTQAQQQGIKLNFNSVSLVTPDDLRAFAHGKSSEKGMLLDQVEALHSFEDENGKPIDFDLGDGIKIPLQLNVNTFNFGVNAGAVDWELGTINQYKQNLKALKGLQKQVEQLKEHISDEGDKANLDSLMKDINALMKDRKAYLSGDNQYEVGAKIVNVTNLMDRIVKKEKGKGTDLEKMGFKSAFNCMSGKDRTGVMDCIAKTYATMADINGTFPTTEELRDNQQIRAQFQKIVVPLLLQSGSLEITYTNTGAIGYKVTKHALIGGMSPDHFLDIIGLSKTTSS
ncbi:inositol phosphate phosphatase SopB [Candidatus Protochlamydia phocaeensis]|uniref:inositol phosphate phosphatase SopB n=1 Tax=Candidatus Protochlamydia phocaeensis TaxID=1414722 RepID=UPI0008394687|nr:inositol phosphate phosphatase SopB [Candidatus Protochlamydia phocaeensis]